MGDNRIKGTTLNLLINSKDWKSVLGETYQIPEFVIKQLIDIIQEEKRVFLSCEKLALANFIKYEVNLYNLKEQFKLYKQLKHPKGNTLENYIVRYGPVVAEQKYKEKNINSTVSLDRWIKKYGKEEAIKKWEELKTKKLNSRENFIKKYGEIKGMIKWKKFRDNCSNNKKLPRLIEIYGVDEGHKKYQETKEKEKNKGSLQQLILKHGEEKGRQVFEDRMKKLSFGSSYAGYIEKYGEELGKKLCKEKHNNTSLLSFQKRYGAEEGFMRFNKYSKKMSNSLKLDHYIEKYGENEGSKKFYERLEKTQNCGFVSKVSQKLFWEIFNRISNENVTNYYKFYELNKEFVTYSKKLKRVFMYDFVDMKNKKCIEFNGDIFHGNPEIFNKNDTPHPWRKDTKCEQLWKEDQEKINTINEIGFEVLVIWEKEYYNDKELTINKALTFLNEINKN